MDGGNCIRRLATAVVVGAAGAIVPALPNPEPPPLPTGMAGKLIAHYHMQPIPVEGAWFSVTYSTEDAIDGAALPARYAGRKHAAGSAIVVIETPRDFSALHRLQTDEVWHFYGGSPLTMLLLYPDGHGRTVTLGPDVLAGESPQVTVPRGVWQGSAPRASGPGSYSFVGTQMSPAFDAADFEIGYRDELQRRYPAFAQSIARLSRAEFASRAAGARAAHAEMPATSAPPAPPAPRASPVAAAAAFSAEDLPKSTMAPGVTLQELVGRVARDAKSSALSIAKFNLAPGASSGMSFNHRAVEVFLVTQGSGQVRLGSQVTDVGPDSTVFIPAEVPHSIEAGPGSMLEFYAVSAPAFAPEDYVPVKP
jgi:predicted cupin superfamily sugar epimerase/mannose-6-phosphate isomerase-like protein (cupin superfamily)